MPRLYTSCNAATGIRDSLATSRTDNDESGDKPNDVITLCLWVCILLRAQKILTPCYVDLVF